MSQADWAEQLKSSKYDLVRRCQTLPPHITNAGFGTCTHCVLDAYHVPCRQLLQTKCACRSRLYAAVPAQRRLLCDSRPQ